LRGLFGGNTYEKEHIIIMYRSVRQW
jgi:hypothetical protein